MLRRSGNGRGGFSLIELLVVISILGVLMGLVLVGVNKVRDVGPRADTTSRIAAISQAVGTFKSSASFGNMKYIPPGGSFSYSASSGPSSGSWGAFRLRDTYPAAGGAQPDINSFEAQYIIQVFGVRPTLVNGNPQITTLGSPGLSANLDANQTLTFFLTGIPSVKGTSAVFTGFSTNSQAPFTASGTTDETRKGPLLDLGGGGKPKYALDTTNNFARLLDGYGNPFVYFAAYEGRLNAYYGSGTGYGGFNSFAPGVQPYANTVSGQKTFENQSGFQLISAGADGKFGASGTLANVDQNGLDDQSNFSASPLGAGNR